MTCTNARTWGAYADAYEDMIRHTATDCAPWYVIPADHKWFARLVVAEVIVDALDSLELGYPKVSAAKRKELAAVRTALLIEQGVTCPSGRTKPSFPAQPGRGVRSVRPDG